jgi:hypothetical protein
MVGVPIFGQCVFGVWGAVFFARRDKTKGKTAGTCKV